MTAIQLPQIGKRRSHIVWVALAALASSQCQVKQHEDKPAATSTVQTVATSKPGPPCGGAAAQACPEGQICVLPQHKGGLEVGDGGRCAAAGAEGTPCGGSEGAKCHADLKCAPAHPPPNRCRRRGAEGTSCGGAVGHPCLAGLVCVLGADEDGVCRRPKGPCGAKRCGPDQICCNWDQGQCVAKDGDVNCK